MNKIEELEKELAAFNQHMKNELHALRGCDQEKQPAEWPQVGDTYWVGVHFDDKVCSILCEGDTADTYLKAIGDTHRTKEEAEAYRAYRMNPRTVMRDKIQQFVDGYNGDWVADWGDYDQAKYSSASNVGVLATYTTAKPFATKDIEGAELLLEKFGLDNIMWACGGPEPGGE